MKMYENSGLMNEANKEIIAFGLARFFDTVVSWIFTLVCAGLMGDLLVGVLFEASYMVLRSFAGGYHAKNRRHCFFLTYFSTFVCIILIFVVPINEFEMSIMLFLFNFIICHYAPVQSENKPLNTSEKKVYRKKSIGIAIFETVLYFLLILIDLSIYSKTIFFSMSIIVLGMIIALLKTKLKI